MPKQVITELNILQLQKLQQEMGPYVLIIKFSADWCGPCKKISPTFHEFIDKAPANMLFADIDIDENLDLYMSLKKHKMVNGIPVFFAYYGNITNRDKWFIPDDSVVGADEISVKEFFDRSKIKAIELLLQSQGYSYFGE